MASIQATQGVPVDVESKTTTSPQADHVPVAVPPTDIVSVMAELRRDIRTSGESLIGETRGVDAYPYTNGPSLASLSRFDPIRNNIVTIQEGDALHQTYVWRLLSQTASQTYFRLRSFLTLHNSYIALLDEQLHTYEYVRYRCPSLHIAILTAVAKTEHLLAYERLRDLRNLLFGHAFTVGQVSVELAQALSIACTWRDPGDRISCLWLGHAIRYVHINTV